MPGSTSLLGFVAAALVVLLIPGPGVLYIVARSLSQGRRAGLVSVFGLSVGAFVRVGAATAGLSAILLTSATAFGFVKALGAGYLIYLGISTLFACHPSAGVEAPTPCSIRPAALGLVENTGRVAENQNTCRLGMAVKLTSIGAAFAM